MNLKTIRETIKYLQKIDANDKLNDHIHELLKLAGVYASKLWTEKDIRMAICANYPNYTNSNTPSKKLVQLIKNEIDWNSMINCIRDTNEIIRATSTILKNKGNE